MNYVQLDIGGRVRGLKFNQLSLEVFSKHIDLEYGTVPSTIYAIFYAGLIGNCYVKKEEPNFTFENVCDWVDTLYDEGKTDDIKRVSEVWAETKTYRDWLQKFQDKLRAILEPEISDEDEETKKVTLITSSLEPTNLLSELLV